MNAMKSIGILCLFFTAMISMAGCGADGTRDAASGGDTIRISTFHGPNTMGMAKLMTDTEQEHLLYAFSVFGSVDEVTPKLVQGELDMAVVSANYAATLYNHNEHAIQVLAVNNLGVLYIVENGDSIKSIEDLRGRTIYGSGKGATPEILLSYILKQHGMDINRDVNMEWKSEHAECETALNTVDGAIAILPQPFITAAQMVDPRIRVAVDLTDEWNAVQKAAGGDTALITNVLIARKDFVRDHPAAVQEFLSRYSDSIRYANTNPTDAAPLIAQVDSAVTAEVAARAIPYCNMTFMTGEEMKKNIAGYLKVLYDVEPKSIGGALPDEDFYYIP